MTCDASLARLPASSAVPAGARCADRAGPGDDEDDDDETPIGDPPDDDEGDDWDDDDDEDDEEPLQVRDIAMQHRHPASDAAQWRPDRVTSRDPGASGSFRHGARCRRRVSHSIANLIPIPDLLSER
jgi:hypothetical protein